MLPLRELARALLARRCCCRDAPAAAAASSHRRRLASAAAPSSSAQQPVQFTPRAMTDELIRKIGATDEALRAAYDAVPAAFPAHSQPGAGAGGQPAVDHQAALRKRLLYRSKQRGWCVAAPLRHRRRRWCWGAEGGGRGWGAPPPPPREPRGARGAGRRVWVSRRGAAAGCCSVPAPQPAPPPPLARARALCRLEVDLLMGSWAAKHLAALPDAQLVEYERLLNRETIDIYNYITGKDAPPPELLGPVLDSIRAFVASSPLGKASTEDYARMKGVFSN